MSLRREEIEKIAQNIIRKSITKKQVIVFNLPSEYIGSKTKTDGKKEVTTFGKGINVSKIRTLRKLFYNLLHRVAYKSLIGWVSFEDVPEQLWDAVNDVIREYNNLFGFNNSNNNIKIVEVYLPSDFLEDTIKENIKKLSLDYKKLQQKIAEAEEDYKKVKRLINQSKQVEEELKKLENELRFLTNRV